MSDTSEIRDWLGSLDNNWILYAKRLSANDTGLTGGHQVGVYIPKEAGTILFPMSQSTSEKNPDDHFPASVDSHSLPERQVRFIYYNNKHSENRKNGRDEQRITQWKQDLYYMPIQDVENTGALTVFAFHKDSDGRNSDCLRVWVCRDVDDEDYVEELVGEILPGEWICDRINMLTGGVIALPKAPPVPIRLPPKWEHAFPTGKQILEYVIQNFDDRSLDPDRRLLKRRDREYAVFRALEDLHVQEGVRDGFDTVDDFIDLANSVGNRRKSRSGKSLELNLETIFTEEGLVDYEAQCVTEEKKKPDFLFPSCGKYHDMGWPAEKLRMLAVKTTCKDRWRQILSEANRIPTPHLLTLQEGVSENQINEMRVYGVTLVVPKPLHKKYPEKVRSCLMTLHEFIETTVSMYQ